MQSSASSPLVISGVGVTSAVGHGQAAFSSGLMNGKCAFDMMRRPGRQSDDGFIGAEMPDLEVPRTLSPRLVRPASLTALAALVTLHEAWNDANLDPVDPSRIGLVVGGSNLQQRALVKMQDEYRGRLPYLRPSYAVSFMDSDLCGLCTEQFGIRGFAYTAGGASASGQLAILLAMQAVQTGLVDVCIAVGALMDLSYWECQSMRSLGAMGSDRYSAFPDLACRPFDKNRDGFIFGECCGAVVIEQRHHAARDNVHPYCVLAGAAVVMDAHRAPDPSQEGEEQAIRAALSSAGLSAHDIDYVNPHGSGSIVGDDIELKAIVAAGLSHAHINATKSVVGHGLSAAGAVEVIATVLQMKLGTLHPTRNLEQPIEPDMNWVTGRARPYAIRNALNLSIGFGGINTALCITRCPNG
jgi:malonyl-ACP decarboxylase